MLFLSVFVLSPIALPGIPAQILHTTPLWNSGNITVSHSDRVNAADAALSHIVNRLDSFGNITDSGTIFSILTMQWTNLQILIDLSVADTLHFYEALANYNAMTHQQNLSDKTMLYFRSLAITWNNTGNAPNGFVEILRQMIQMGYTAIRAYLSLGDDYLLDQAKEYWDLINIYTISNSDLQSGRTSGKNFSLPQTCNATGEKVSLAGALFQNASRQSSVIDMYETAYFFLFSSIMASLETSPLNGTYAAAARASLDFVMQHPFVPEFGVATEIKELGECGNISLIWPGGTSTVGFVIEGLSILAVLEDDEDLHKLLLETIQRAFDTTGAGWPSAWGNLLNYHDQSTPGVPKGAPDALAWDIEFVRGLAVAYRKATSLPSDIRDAIRAFLGVQYNTVRKQANVGNNIYDGSWQDPSFRGGYSPSFDVVNQSFAAQVLIDGIDIFDELPPPTTSSSSRVPVTTLAGSIVGGVLFLVILIALAAFLYRRHQRRQSATADSNTSHPPSLFFSTSAIFVGPNTEITPFEWDSEWREPPIQNMRKLPLSIDQNLNREHMPDQVAPLGERPVEPPVVNIQPVDNDSSPPEYRSQ
ncbi:hypothetical protein VNI00_001903 [Paramarasmius palmivorus]|uniref:Glycoside hydrolase family 76 protein n=1 Tax=Paramarasmius palmivorus TaxID=297713 RepID=A0AAW0E6S3_9AGAR